MIREFFEQMVAFILILLMISAIVASIIGVSIVSYNMLLHFSLAMGGVVSG